MHFSILLAISQVFSNSSTLQISNGSTYKGVWWRCIFHGYGTLIKRDGTSYTGFWHNGKLHGFAQILRPDGTSYEAYFQYGKFKGGIGHDTAERDQGPKPMFVKCNSNKVAGKQWAGVIQQSIVNNKLLIENRVVGQAKLNSLIKELYAINQEVLDKGKKSIDDLDSRDKLINQIAEYLDIDVIHADNGTVNLRDYNGVDLVPDGVYAESLWGPPSLQGEGSDLI